MPANVSAINSVPDFIDKPEYYPHGTPFKKAPKEFFSYIAKKDMKDFAAACQLAKTMVEYAGSLVKQGVTTDFIDQCVHQAIIDSGAYPSPLHYCGFPKSICTSINNVKCHGIPDSRPLKGSDIISIDVTVFYKGFHGDTCRTFSVGNHPDPSALDLMETAQKCLHAGISAVKPGIFLNEIGSAIEQAASKSPATVCDLTAGHGIGRYFHMSPTVAHTENESNCILQPGMAFTIEPVLVEGCIDSVLLPDEWTLISSDGKRSAQYEHTIVVTDDGCEILT